jgi:hypothetical protein
MPPKYVVNFQNWLPFGCPPAIINLTIINLSHHTGLHDGRWLSMSVLALVMCIFSYGISQLGAADVTLTLLQQQLSAAANIIHQGIPVLENLAICIAWPSPCHEGINHLINSGFTNGPGLAFNIGIYHTLIGEALGT